MRAKLFTLCLLALLINISSRAQDTDLSRIPSQTATLLSHTGQKSYEKSVFNFECGVRGDAELPKRPSRYDIRYGGISENGDDRWLDIVHRSGAQSMIKDTGEMKWAEVYHVPVLFASPNPHTGELTHSYAGGRLQRISPEEVIVKAIVGHMYVMHIKDQETDYYVMFRVEAIDPKGECRLSWKLVASPER
ncbi:MAG: hypothetical protein LC754_18700 [Acidobacteria bacterium]|nr:hypothetical protein [Acidobacteriota bacterium]